MNISNQYLITYIPGSGWNGYLDGKLAGHWGEDQFEEMVEWKRQYAPKTEPNPAKAPGTYDPNDTFERRELTKDEIKELATRLAEKYDPSNMTQEEYDSFLDDLVEEGILSRNQLGQLGYHGFVVLGSLKDATISEMGGVYMHSENIMTHHNNPYYQRYGYAMSLSDTNGDALAYASLMSLLHPGSGSSTYFQNYAEKRQSNFEAMAEVLEAMQRQRQS